MARTYEFVVGPMEAALRLDHYLLRHLPKTISRAALQRAIRGGSITINGHVLKAHQPVKTGQVIRAVLQEVGDSDASVLRSEPIALDVLYEDAHLLVVNKPAGLVTHPAPGHWSGTLVNAILWHLEGARGTGQGAREVQQEPPSPGPHPSPLPRAGIVHRLDKDTSGALLVAKTSAALLLLSKQLKARTIQRRYVAVVEGHVALEEGTVNAAIGRHLRHRKQMAVRYLGGRQAVTHYRVLKRDQQSFEFRVPSSEFNPKPARPGVEFQGRAGETRNPKLSSPPLRYSVLEVQLETGRTHQIRVHMAQQGYPVLGDSVYGRHPAAYWTQHGIRRQLLHAYQLHLLHPESHKSLAVTAPIPYDMHQWTRGVLPAHTSATS